VGGRWRVRIADNNARAVRSVTWLTAIAVCSSDNHRLQEPLASANMNVSFVFRLPKKGDSVKRASFVLGTLLCCAMTVSAIAADGAALTFEKHVRPILKAHCFQCHGEGDELAGGLDLRLRRFMSKGGESGAAIVPSNSVESLLLQRVRDGEMPPGDDISKKPSKDEIAVIARWIDLGANTARPEPDVIKGGFLITEEDRQFWSFQPIRRPNLPAVQQPQKLRSAIDAFVLARLEQKGLSFSLAADRLTLLRRATLDLIGLPPTPEEVEEFLADESVDAYGRLIDRLLESPHYGERWGRHWLDVAGYADSEGYTEDDTVRPWAYKYRDYVIRSFNANKPFDQFIREQLAGDEMLTPPYKNLTAEQADNLIATGFLRMAPDATAGSVPDANLARNDVMAETIKIVSSSLLGMTVGCSQCHNHRYDPIPQSDYYAFRAIFEPAYDWKKWRSPTGRRISLYSDADRKKAAEIETEAKKIDQERSKKQSEYIQRTFEKELAKLPAELREPIKKARDTPEKKRTAEQKKLLKEHPSVNVSAGSLYLYDRKAADDLKKIAARAAKVRGTKPIEEFVRALTEVSGQVPATFLFYRGDHDQPKQQLKPASLTILTSDGAKDAIPENDSGLPTTGRRLAYARLLTNGRHPLTARVLANRIWMHHFGRGIVPTPGDFGALGEKPTHPELLNWLAAEFMSNGWNLKRLHKLIMTSAVYRQELRRDPKHDEIDPDNRLLGGMPLRRLEAEAIRDAILSVSGKLNDTPFGPGVPVMHDRVGQIVIGKENLNAGRPGAVIPLKGEEFRRSVFVQVRRSRPVGVLATFDAPRMEPNCEKRTNSTVTPQSLMLMNSDFVVRQSEHFARRIKTNVGDDPAKQISYAWKLSFGRTPAAEELNEATQFLKDQTTHFAAIAAKSKKKKDDKSLEPATQALANLCQMLFSSNAFLYVD